MLKSHEGPRGSERPFTRRAALSLACLALAGMVTLRIKAVNDGALVIPEETYGLGTWLDLEDSVKGSREVDTRGYGFRVDDVEAVTPNGYLERYGRDDVRRLDSIDAEETCVIAMTMTIRNRGNTEGGIKGYLWQLVPETLNNTFYKVDTELFSHAVPELGGVTAFSVEDGGTSTVTLPFSTMRDPPLFRPAGVEERMDVVKGPYRLAMTDMPVRKVLRFEL